jgi:hypothetical protein
LSVLQKEEVSQESNTTISKKATEITGYIMTDTPHIRQLQQELEDNQAIIKAAQKLRWLLEDSDLNYHSDNLDKLSPIIDDVIAAAGKEISKLHNGIIDDSRMRVNRIKKL